MAVGFRNERYFGESSTGYTAIYRGNSVPDLVHQYAPEARLIFCIRNPIARIISHFKQDVSQKRQIFSTIIPDDRFEKYLAQSCYFTQITPWIRRFTESQIKIILLEDISSDSIGQMNAICDFLSLPRFDADTRLHPLNESARKQMPAESVKLTPEQFGRAIQLLDGEITAMSALLGRDLRGIWKMDSTAWT